MSSNNKVKILYMSIELMTSASHMISIIRLLVSGSLDIQKLDKFYQKKKYLKILWQITQRRPSLLSLTLTADKKRPVSTPAIMRK
jgi:hypothetical protein